MDKNKQAITLLEAKTKTSMAQALGIVLGIEISQRMDQQRIEKALKSMQKFNAKAKQEFANGIVIGMQPPEEPKGW